MEVEINGLIQRESVAHAQSMASLNREADPVILEGFEAAEGLVPVAVFEDFQTASEAGLAILSMGSPYWTFIHGAVYVICVSDEVANSALKELAEIARLQANLVRGGGVALPSYGVGPWSFILYAVILTGIYVLQSQASISVVGRVDSIAMFKGGEWWRAVTALTLHGDVVHLVSNLVGGAGFAFLLTRFFGAGAAWFLILVSGILGNVMNAWLHYPELHLSIGASTGVFGALGMLTGIGIWHAVADVAEMRRWRMPEWLLPAFGGFTLLGLLGVGEGPVDVAAHISGFLCGCVLGGLGALVRGFFERIETARFWVGGLSLLVIGGAWAAAYRGL